MRIQVLGSERQPELTRAREVFWPIWGPGNHDLVFAWQAGQERAVLGILSPYNSERRALSTGGGAPSSLSPGGRHLAVVRDGDIWILSLQDGKVVSEARLHETPDVDEAWPEFSPDGKYLAYGSNSTKKAEVYVRPYPGAGAGWQVSGGEGYSPAWNTTGGELFFIGGKTGQRAMMVASFRPGSPDPVGTPQPLFYFDPAKLRLMGRPVRNYDVERNGRGFYAVRTTSPRAPEVKHINVRPNWFEELKTKVPVKR